MIFTNFNKFKSVLTKCALGLLKIASLIVFIYIDCVSTVQKKMLCQKHTPFWDFSSIIFFNAKIYKKKIFSLRFFLRNFYTEFFTKFILILLLVNWGQAFFSESVNFWWNFSIILFFMNTYLDYFLNLD